MSTRDPWYPLFQVRNEEEEEEGVLPPFSFLLSDTVLLILLAVFSYLRSNSREEGLIFAHSWRG